MEFIVIGLSDSKQPFFSPEVRSVIAAGRVFSGGKRHHEIVAEMLPEEAVWIDITVPLEQVFEAYQSQCLRLDVQSVVVFASGDPLFYGFANTIRRKMPEAFVRLFPTFNSLQTLAHRLVMPYHDMRIVSLTGRPWPEFDRALIERAAKIGVLTDREHHPAAIARRMMEYGYTYYKMYVGEHLGSDEKEHICDCTLEEAATRTFDYPNCLILVKEAGVDAPRPFGIADADFALLDGRERMITKMPIRLLSLQALELNRHKVLWDIGFCTGSVSIEARLQFPHLQVVSFEVRQEGERLMKENSRKFGTPGITALIGDFLAADLTGLPCPDAVFIGGHGGKLKEIMARVVPLLPSGGCVVMNSVTSESLRLFNEAVEELGMEPAPATHLALNDYNPIDILRAIKR